MLCAYWISIFLFESIYFKGDINDSFCEDQLTKQSPFRVFNSFCIVKLKTNSLGNKIYKILIQSILMELGDEYIFFY